MSRRSLVSRTSPSIEAHPLTPDRWRDFAALMTSRFDVRRCWCMAPRLDYSYKRRTGETNRRSIKRVVDTNAAPPGVLAYVDGVPAGWCAISPREQYPRYELSRARAGDHDEHVWSIVCFYVLRPMRGRGLHRALLSAAVNLATEHGGKIIEAYPVERTRNVFRGLPSVFRDAGFTEVARRGPDQMVMRLVVSAKPRRTRPRAGT